MKCYKCGKEFDPSMDFVEDVDLLEALDYFIAIDGMCSTCMYALRDKLATTVKEFLQGD